MKKSHLFIINSRGEKEKFSFKKLYRSLKRSGLSSQMAREVARSVEKNIYPGARTRDINRWVQQLLKSNLHSRIRFTLKESMRRLGPTGFPFEKFIKEVLEHQGFSVKINQYIRSYCGVLYEIDFLAQKENLFLIGECKYHREFGARVDLQVVLANYARFLDIKKSPMVENLVRQGYEVETMLVTNTKFTTEAIKYARCVGTRLLGWRFPRENSLEYIIEQNKLYPITILPSLKGYLKDIFSQKKIMLVQDILKMSPERLARSLGIDLKTARLLCRQAQTVMESDIENRADC